MKCYVTNRKGRFTINYAVFGTRTQRLDFDVLAVQAPPDDLLHRLALHLCPDIGCLALGALGPLGVACHVVPRTEIHRFFRILTVLAETAQNGNVQLFGYQHKHPNTHRRYLCEAEEDFAKVPPILIRSSDGLLGCRRSHRGGRATQSNKLTRFLIRKQRKVTTNTTLK